MQHSWFRVENRIFFDEAFMDFKPEELLVWFFILAYASSKSSPSVKYNAEYISRHTGVKVAAVHSAIKKLESQDCIAIHNEQSILRPFSVTQPDNNITRRTNGNLSVHENFDEESRESQGSQGIHDAGTDTTPDGACTVADRSHTNERTNERTRTPRVRNTSVFDFEPLYQKYPRKEGKTRGIAKCVKEVCTKEAYEELSVAIDRFAKQCRQRGTESRFIPHFSTFMGTWRDWLDPQAGTTNVEDGYQGLTEEQHRELWT